MAGPLRPNPPPSSLMAVGKLEKKGFKKSFFFLKVIKAIKRRTFFAASLKAGTNLIYINKLKLCEWGKITTTNRLSTEQRAPTLV